MANRAKRMDKKLPKQTEHGYIQGFVPKDYQVSGDLWDYQKCCQDPDNWRGAGEWKAIAPDDPYYWKGYRRFRDVECGTCGHSIIAHEMGAQQGATMTTPTTQPLTIPLICPRCQHLASYAIPPTLVTCVHCGETAHVLDYDVVITGQGDADARPLVTGEVGG